MFTWLKKKLNGKGKVIGIGSCLILSIITMTVATYAWFTQAQPGTNKLTLKSEDNSVVVDAYAYKPGYSNDANGDPIAIAHSDHSDTPLLQATKVLGPGNATYTVNFDSAALSDSSYSYTSLYGEELYQDEKAFPHVYLEFRYIKPELDGFVQATINNITYVAQKTGFTNLNSALTYEYRIVTEQNTTTTAKHINGFTAAYADTDYTSSAWIGLTSAVTSLDIYNNTTDIAGYNYGASYTVQEQCYIPAFPYKYDGANHYFSKATFIEFRVNPLTWEKYFRDNQTAHAGKYNFGLSFNLALNFSHTPFYDSSSSTQPRVTLSSPLLNMQPSTSDSSVSVFYYNFSATPSFTVAPANASIVSGSVTSANKLSLTSTANLGTTTITLTAQAGTQSAQALITVRVSGPSLTLSVNSLSVKMGSFGSITADAYNFSGTATISSVSSDTSKATVSTSGSSITVTPVAMGETTITVTATDGTTIKTATCAVTVVAGDKTLVSISCTNPDKVLYNVGDILDTTGCVVTALWNDNTTTAVSGASNFDPTELTASGTQTITVSYGGKTTTFEVTVTAEGAVTYTLVTSTSALVSGKRYIIANSKTAGSAYAMSTTQNDNNRSQEAVTVISSSGVMKIAASDAVEQLTLGGSSGAWTWQTSSNGYLDATGTTSSNVLNTASAVGDDTSWTVSFSSDAAVITDTGKTSHNIIRHNSTSSLFSCYTSGQHDIYLYVENASSSLISSIAVTTNPTKTTYARGETLDLTGMVVTATYQDSSTAVITDYAASPSNGSYLMDSGTKAITITASGKTASFNVTVSDSDVVSISVDASQAKKTYYVGDAFSNASLGVTATFANGNVAPVPSSGYTTDPLNGATLSTASASKTVIVTYGGKTATYSIEVIAVVLDHIAVTTQPTTTTYPINGTFSSDGLVVTAYYNNGASAAVTGYTLSPNPPDMTTAGTKTITVSYTESSVTKTTTFTVEVGGQATGDIYELVTSSSDVTSGGEYLIASGKTGAIQVMGAAQTEYFGLAAYTVTTDNQIVYDSTTMSSLTLTPAASGNWTFVSSTDSTKHLYSSAVKKLTFSTATDSSTTYNPNPSEFTISIAASNAGYPYRATIACTATSPADHGTIQYNTTGSRFNMYTSSQSAVYLFKRSGASSKTLSSIAVTTDPTKTTYNVNETIDTAGMVVTASYTDTTTAVVTSSCTSSPTSFSSSGQQTVTVSYTEGGITKTDTFYVTVNASSKVLSSITSTGPTKTTYEVGNTLDTSGLVVTAHYTDGTSAAVTAYTTDPANGTTLSTVSDSQAVTISYTESGVTKTTSFNIIVNAISLTYNLVTNVSQLTSGSHVIIVNATADGDGGFFALGPASTNGNNIKVSEKLTITSNSITLGTSSTAAILTVGTTDTSGVFTFYDPTYSYSNISGGYLCAASSSSNYLRAKTTIDDAAKWAVTIDSGTYVASVTAGAYTRNVMRYNSGSDLFACYAPASQGDIKIYIRS